MVIPRKIELINREELLEELLKSDCSTTEKIHDIVYSQPVIAVATPRLEIEMMVC